MRNLLPLICLLIDVVSAQAAFMYGRAQPEKEYKTHYGKQFFMQNIFIIEIKNDCQ